MPPKFPKLAGLADQIDPLVTRRTLLEALDCVIEMCANRTRSALNGNEYDDPDSNGINKAIELAARITGNIGIDPVVLIQFKNDTEKLVKRAQAVLRDKEKTAKALTVTGEGRTEEA